jgi:acyl-coenzyme A synthetase/AMP-(fatty) acid ligase
MALQLAVLPDHVRYGLKLNPKLGAGNFLQYAQAVNRGNVPLIHSDKPFEVLGRPPQATMSIAELYDITNRYAAWYYAHGIRPMDPVAVYARESVHYLVQYTALTSIGAVPILTNGTMAPHIAAQHFSRMGAMALVTDRQHEEALKPHIRSGSSLAIYCLEDITGDDPDELPAWFPFSHDHDDPVMITHTSGTTGVPKGVLLQHGRWFHGVRHLLGLDAAQGADRYLSSLPASHNASIAYCIHAILNGAALMIMDDRSGEAVANAIGRFRPATVVSFPQTYVELAGLDLKNHDLTSVTAWINSGDAAHEAHIRRLVAYGYHFRGEQRVAGSQFIDGLGSSELGHSSFRIIHTPYTDSYDRCVGLPQSWVEAAVLDPDGEPVELGVVGRLGVRSPSVTSGYWNDSLLTHRSRLRGYWLTGDLVYRDHLGCYYHLDRVSDVIQTSTGLLYSLQTEELILKHHDELADCTVVGMADSSTGVAQAPVLLAVPGNGRHVEPTALLEQVNAVQAAHRRPPLAHIRMVDQGEIPAGVTGKVLKRALREQLSSQVASFAK